MSEYRSTGWAAHRDHYAVPVLFNPYTGQPRDVRDVQSDPQGILIVPPGKVEMRASKPTVKESLRVATPPAAPVQDDLTPAYMSGLYDGKKARRQWVGLTIQEASELWESTDSDWELMKRTEAKLKEKNA